MIAVVELNKNNRWVFASILVLFFFMFVGTTVAGQNSGVTIEVQYLLGYPIPNASIYVDGFYAGATNDNGVFMLTGYTTGMHNITVVHEKYENSSKEVDLSRVSDVLLRMQDKWEVVPPDAMTIYARENTAAQSMITGADVYIDETLVGETDHYGKFWITNYTGLHTVRISKKGSVDAINTINFMKGSSDTLYLDRVDKKYSIFDGELFIYALSKELALGVVSTVKLSVIAFAVGIAIGLVMGLGRVSKNRITRYLASVYVEGVRGLPLVLQLLFVYYGLPFFLKDLLGMSLIINEFYAAIIALSLNSGAYMAEIFKAGIEAIHKGQMEAARSVGMSYWQAMRYVILPQAFKIVLPALGNEFIALIKDSSISLVISYQELTYWAKSVGYEYYNAFTPLVAAGCLYLLITIPLGKLVQYIEKRYSISSPREEGAGFFGRRRKASGNGGNKPEGTA